MTALRSNRSPAALIRQLRRRSGITQSELAARMRTTQSAVARLERPGSDPRISTVAAALGAMGQTLELTATAIEPDLTLAQAHRRLTPLERVRAHDAASANLSGMMSRVRRLPREHG